MIRRVAIMVLLIFGAWQFGHAGWIQGKAWLGQVLLERAWQQALDGERRPEPWPGAVSYPIARLRMPRLDIDYLVLNGAETRVLAWGPGMESGIGGHRMIAAHRDTHFRFLERLRGGDRIELQHADGATETWQVDTIEIVDSRNAALDMSLPARVLTLVTCYPFDAPAAGGPLRYVVSLSPAPSATIGGAS